MLPQDRRECDSVPVLALHPPPPRSDVGMERPLADNVFPVLDGEFEFGHLLESELGPVGNCSTGCSSPESR